MKTDKHIHIPAASMGGGIRTDSRAAIYNSLIPIVGAVTSCLCLGETFHAKYALAGGLAALGMYVINKGKN